MVFAIANAIAGDHNNILTKQEAQLPQS